MHGQATKMRWKMEEWGKERKVNKEQKGKLKNDI